MLAGQSFRPARSTSVCADTLLRAKRLEDLRVSIRAPELAKDVYRFHSCIRVTRYGIGGELLYQVGARHRRSRLLRVVSTRDLIEGPSRLLRQDS